MAKFAKECLDKFNDLAKQLEITLGPDTADLAMRAGVSLELVWIFRTGCVF